MRAASQTRSRFSAVAVTPPRTRGRGSKGARRSPPLLNDDPVLLLEPLQRRDAHRPPHVVLFGAVAGSVLDQLAALHEPVAVDDQLLARGADQVVLAAHDDRLFRARVHAETAVDAAEQVDLEAGGVLL